MFTPILLADIPFTAYVIGGVIAFVIVLFMLLGLWASRYTKVGPNEVLVVSGRKHRYADPDGTVRDARLPHRQRRRHLRHPGAGKSGQPLAGIAHH